jgi:hypothetical protein
VECVDLRFRYGKFEPTLLDGLDLKIAPGESAAIVRENSAGCEGRDGRRWLATDPAAVDAHGCVARTARQGSRVMVFMLLAIK